MKRKRFLSMALCVLMLVSILPVSVLAEGETEAPVSYDLWVNGVNVTSANATDVLGNGTVSYDEQGNMLKLTNATLSQTYPAAGEGACAIYYNGNRGLAIIAMGRNIVNTNNNGVGDGGTDSTAIYASGDLRLSGLGYLGAHGTAAIKSKGTVTIDSNIHLVAEAASSRPIEANSIEYPSNPWRTSKTDHVFQTTEPQFDGNYFEMLGVDHAMKDRVFADNGNGTHKISCGECNEVILASAPHRKSTTLCDCGIPLAVVGDTNADPEGDVYWLLHEALNTAAEGQYITLFTYTHAEPATMALHQSATVQSGRKLLLGTLNGQSSGHNIAVGDGVTLTFAKGSKAYLLNNGLSLSGSGKVVDLGGDFYHWANSQPTLHSHQDMTKTYTDNGDGTHSATVDCDTCKVIYHVPVSGTDMTAPHTYGEGGTCLCGEKAEASYTTASGLAYGTLGEAFASVAADGEITLLKNAVLKGQVTSQRDATFDLNGFAVSYGGDAGTAPEALFAVSNGELTLIDSKTGGKIEYSAKVVTVNRASVIHKSGSLVSTAESAVTVTDYSAYELCGGTVQSPTTAIHQTGGHVTLAGGSLSGKTGVSVQGGYFYLSGSPAIEGTEADIEVNDQNAPFLIRSTTTDISGIYTVRTKTTPTEAAPVNFARPYTTPDISQTVIDPALKNFAPAQEGFYVGYAADGWLALYAGECKHGTVSENGCSVCGVPAVAKVTVANEDTFYADMQTAIIEWRDNETVSGAKTLTLLQSGQWSGMNYMYLPAARRTLDLNGFTLTAGHGFWLKGTDFTIQDSGTDGTYTGKVYVADDGSSLTLLGGKLDGTTGSAIMVDSVATDVSITIQGGTVSSGGSCIHDFSNAAAISVEGGTVSNTSTDTGNYAIQDGKVTISGTAVVERTGAGGYAVKAPSVTVKDAPSVGTIYYSNGYKLNFGSYSGAGLDIYFEDAYDTATDTDITLPTKYGFFNAANEELSSIAAGSTVRVMQRHEHDWSFSSEGNVITAVCAGSVGVCPVENKTATITLKAPGNLVYDGTKKECTLEQSVEGLFDLSAGKLEYSAEPIGVGSYTADFTYEGVKASLSFAIVARVSPTLTLGKTEIEYSGSPAQPGATLTAELDGQSVTLVEGTDYTLNYGTETAVGSTVTVTASPKEGGSYIFDPVSAAYKIVQATPVYSTPSGLTATYGQNLEEHVALPTAENGTWRWDGRNFPVGEVGENTHTAIFTPTDEVNYKSVSVAVKVKVNPAPITITGATVSSKTYDGSAQVSVTLLNVKGIISGESVTIKELSGLKGTAPSANAGSYTEVTLPTLSLTGDDAANYTLTQPGKVAASYAIGPKSVYPIVEVAAGTYRYSGAAQTPVVTVKDGSTVIPAEEYTVTYSSNVHAGTGYATVSDKSGGNYELTQVTGSFTIQPAVITITADNKSATTGQKAPALTYTVSGLAAGEKLSKNPTVSYVTTPDMSKAGTTLIRAGGAVAPSTDYLITYVDGTLTVTKAASTGGSYTGGSYTGTVSVTVDMSGVELVSKTYDGKPISYGGKASARYYTGDFTYTWYTANGYKLTEAPTDAGDYVLRATVSRSGYTGYGSKNVTIRKATLTITADDLSAQVGDELPELSYSVKGLGSGDKLKTEPQLSFETEPDMSKPGKTPILVSGAEVPDSKNYEKDIKYIEGTLTVGDKETEPEAEAETPDTAPAEPIRKLEVSVGSADKELEKALDSKNSAHYELALRESSDGGQNWTDAGSELPEGGVQVSLPLPEGSDENCSFRIVHADGEYPVTVTKHEDGQYYLDFTATTLGPVAVGWTAPGKDGGFPWWILVLLAGAGAVGGGIAYSRKRRQY